MSDIRAPDRKRSVPEADNYEQTEEGVSSAFVNMESVSAPVAPAIRGRIEQWKYTSVQSGAVVV